MAVMGAAPVRRAPAGPFRLRHLSPGIDTLRRISSVRYTQPHTEPGTALHPRGVIHPRLSRVAVSVARAGSPGLENSLLVFVIITPEGTMVLYARASETKIWTHSRPPSGTI